jgi:hypothetical protein
MTLASVDLLDGNEESLKPLNQCLYYHVRYSKSDVTLGQMAFNLTLSVPFIFVLIIFFPTF